MNQPIQSPKDEVDNDELQYPSFWRRVRNRVFKHKKTYAFLLLLAIIFSCLGWRVYQRHQLLYEIVNHYGSVSTNDGPLPQFANFLPRRFSNWTRSVSIVTIQILDPNSKAPRVINLDHLDKLYLFHEVKIIRFRRGPVVRDHILQLAKNKQIVGLGFHYTILPPRFLDEIAANCPPIKELDLANSTMQGDAPVDEQMKKLSVLNGLVSLGLEGTNVSNEGIAHLESVDTLEYLCVSNTQVSQQAIDRLCKKLPKLKIVDYFDEAIDRVRRGATAKQWAQ